MDAAALYCDAPRRMISFAGAAQMRDDAPVTPNKGDRLMGSYRISVRHDAGEDEFSVVVHDETQRSLAKVGAFSALHAQKVVRDLMSLVRKSDPEGAFTLDMRDRLRAN